MKKLYYCEDSAKNENIRTKLNRTTLSVLTTLFFLFGTIGVAKAQSGSTCNDPMPILVLPFNDGGDTGDYGNNYTSADRPAIASGAVTDGTGSSSYLGGFDVVYSITPTIAGNISIDATYDEGWNALWVFTGCPFTSTVGYHTAISGTTRSIPNLPVEAGVTYYIVVSNWDPPSVAYTISVTGTSGLLAPLDDCDEANAGTITSSVSEVCATTSFTLNATGQSNYAEGLVFQWQSSPAGDEDWSDITGANGISYTASAGILAATDFRLKATCSFGTLEDISNEISVAIKDPNECYCAPTVTSGEYLNTINISTTIDSKSYTASAQPNNPVKGYDDLSAQTINTYETDNVSVNTLYTGGSNTVKIWVDWNQNGVFEGNELMDENYVSSATTLNELSFMVPAGTALGEYRMRIRARWSTTVFDACDTQTYGSAVDYTLNLVTPPTCLIPTNLYVSNVSETSAALGWSSNNSESLWNIEYGPAGFIQGEGTLVEGVTDNPYTVTLVPETEYEFYVQADCGNDDESFWAGPFFFSNTYCTPSNTYSTSYYINSVVSEGALTNINKTNTGFTAGGYANYSATDTLRVYPGQTISVTVAHPSSTYGYQVWIDWDENYDFNGMDELVVNTSYVSAPYTIDLTIPLWATEITTRMRIRNAYSDNPSPACGSHDYGEAEDYTFVVVEAPTCLPVEDITTTLVTDNSIEISWTGINSETSWNIEYGPTGFELGTGTTATTTESSFTANDLNPDETYDIYVQADCGNNDESYWNKVTTTTACSATTIPYTQDFESAIVPAIDNCGELETNSGNPWKTDNISSNGFNSNVLRYNYNSQTADSWYFTQGLQMEAGMEYVLTYKYGSNSSSYGEKLRVTLGTGQSTANIVDTLREFTNIINTTAEMDTVLFTPDADGIYYLGFQAFTQPNAYYIYLDDIHVDFCLLQPTEDGYTNVCRLDGVIDLSDVIESPYSHGIWSFNNNPSLIESTAFNISTLPSGVYEVNYIVSNACTADTASAYITVFGASSAGTGGSITACEGEPIALYSGLSGNIDAGGDWYDYNNNLLGTSQPNAPLTEGNYNYTYITSNGVCPADTAVIEVIVDCLAIGEEIMSNVSIYPNPTSSVINVLNPSNLSSLKIEMFDMNGRRVLVDNKSLANSDLGSINIEKLETGIYTLRVYNDEGQKTFKVVKQ